MKPMGYMLAAERNGSKPSSRGEATMQDTDNQTDQLVRNERRGVWLALVVVLVLAATLVLGSDTRRALLLALAIGIVFAVTWLSQQRTRGMKGAIREKRDAVMHDELRQAAITHAYKWAFFTVLGALASFCLLSTVVSISVSGQLVAALTVALAVIAFLMVFLLLDRG
jgi:O-antigen ligase